MPSGEPYNPDDLPTGWDRADGQGGRHGTPSASGQIIASGAGGADTVEDLPVEELDDSPSIDRAEHGTFHHRYRMGWEKAATFMLGLHRGIVRTDSTDKQFWMLSAQLQREKGGKGIITTVEEAIDTDTPPDEFSITPVELGIHIVKHPRYFTAFLGDGYGSVDEKNNQMVIRLLQDYMDNTSAPWRNAIAELLNHSIGTPAGFPTTTQPPVYDSDTQAYPAGSLVMGSDMAKAAALEIITKYWRGEETPSLVGWQMRWTSFYARPQPLNPGGYIEDPMSEAVPAVPPYFWSTADAPEVGDYPADTIFTNMAVINPQSYSDDGTVGGDTIISWRREADQYEWQRVWFAVHRSWVGSPYGFWDPDLYTQADAPLVYTDFREMKFV